MVTKYGVCSLSTSTRNSWPSIAVNAWGMFLSDWQEAYTLHQAANTSERWAGLLQLQHQLQKGRWSCAARPAPASPCGRPSSTSPGSSSLTDSVGGTSNSTQVWTPACGVRAMQLLITVIEGGKLLSASIRESHAFQHTCDLHFCKETPGIVKVKSLCPKGWVSATGNISDLSLLYMLINQLSPSTVSIYLYL